jgi:thiamine pyrophosphate-dependent acetolactate synthase large subunit-like protein
MIAGDGAFYMRAVEIQIALQDRQPVTFGLLDNHPRGTSVTPEQLYYHDRHGCERPISRPTTGEDRPDLLAKMPSDAGMPALDSQ